MKFNEFIDKLTVENECLVFTGPKDGRGYGSFWAAGVKTRAHRYMWQSVNGDIPNNMCICHSCDNTSCVKLEHLFLGTQADNLADMRSKGRGKVPNNSGTSNGRCKLTPEQVKAIREFKGFAKDIAKVFNISTSNATRIRAGHLWKEIAQ